MKTSNQLLTALLLLIFAIPLVLLISFKSAIKNQRFTLKNQQGYEPAAFHAVDSFRVVQIIGDGLSDQGQNSFLPVNGTPGNIQLKCRIRQGHEFGYTFLNYDPGKPEHNRTDSCTVRLKNDTLVLEYFSKLDIAQQPNNYYHGVELELTVPDSITILARQTALELNSLKDTLPTFLRLDLTQGTTLHIQSLLDRRPQISDTLSAANRARLKDYHINARDAKLIIDGHLAFANLSVAADAGSSLEIKEDVQVQQLGLQLNDSTRVAMPFGLLRQWKK